MEAIGKTRWAIAEGYIPPPEVHALGKEVRALLQRVCASLKEGARK